MPFRRSPKLSYSPTSRGRRIARAALVFNSLGRRSRRGRSVSSPKSSVEVGAGHVVTASRVRAEELALSLEECGAARGTDSFGMILRTGRRRSAGNRGPRRFSIRRGFGLHEGFDGSTAGEGVGAGMTAAGVSSSFRTRPAGVRSASIGVVSGVGGAGSTACAACARRPWPAAFEPQPAAERQIAASRRAVRAGNLIGREGFTISFKPLFNRRSLRSLLFREESPDRFCHSRSLDYARVWRAGVRPSDPNSCHAWERKSVTIWYEI